VLYDKDRPDGLDVYIAIAIKIDDRQYIRKQQHKGRARPTLTISAGVTFLARPTGITKDL